jgi:hypothetical protein
MSTVIPTAQAPRKLPVWSTFAKACVLWAKNLPELLRVSWLWLIVYAPVLSLFWWYSLPHLKTSMQAMLAHHPDPTPIVTNLVNLLSELILVPMAASIAVAWHRLLLRSERSPTSTYLRFDRIVIAYAILTFLYLLTAQNSSLLRQMSRFLAFIIDITVLYLTMRLIVYLPAKAIDRRDITLALAWRATRDNGWRLVIGHGLAVFPMVPLILPLYFWAIGTHGNRAMAAAIGVAFSFSSVIGGMIAVAFLSLAYRHFFEDSTAQEAWRAAYASSGNSSTSPTST